MDGARREEQGHFEDGNGTAEISRGGEGREGLMGKTDLKRWSLKSNHHGRYWDERGMLKAKEVTETKGGGWEPPPFRKT